MKIKIGNKQIIIWVNRTKDHKDYIWNNIYLLRQDIIEDVLSYNVSGVMPVQKLKHKADLIKKYSQRLRLLEM
jgi:hypothetical protein|tara:strand:+ start:150 stop:368 length:219 start_codon:yes stop_codon:yes gene_type:complete